MASTRRKRSQLNNSTSLHELKAIGFTAQPWPRSNVCETDDKWRWQNIDRWHWKQLKQLTNKTFSNGHDGHSVTQGQFQIGHRHDDCRWRQSLTKMPMMKIWTWCHHGCLWLTLVPSQIAANSGAEVVPEQIRRNNSIQKMRNHVQSCAILASSMKTNSLSDPELHVEEELDRSSYASQSKDSDRWLNDKQALGLFFSSR